MDRFDGIEAIMPYQQALMKRIKDSNFKDVKICVARTPGKSNMFYDMFMLARQSGKTEFTNDWLTECIEENRRVSEEKREELFLNQYMNDPELMAKLEANDLINEMEKNYVLNKRRNQKQSPRINRRSYQTIGRSK